MFYGKKVLGEAGFAKEKKRRADRRAKGSGLGSRVTGPLKPKKSKVDEDLEQTADEETQDAEVQDPAEQEDPETETDEQDQDTEDQEGEGEQDEEPVKAPKPEVPTLSLKDLEKALKANTSVPNFDKLLSLELERPEGEPRKGALRLFLEAEKRRKPPRAAVVAELTRLAKVAES